MLIIVKGGKKEAARRQVQSLNVVSKQHVANLKKSGIATPGDVHISRPLTNLSVSYVQNESNFVATRIFPTINVKNKTDLYWRQSRDDMFRDEAQPRAAGTRSAGGGIGFDTQSYNCNVVAFHTIIDDQTRGNQDDELNLDKTAVDLVTQKCLIRRERQFMSSYFTSGVWGTDITPPNLWSAANSTPQADVLTGKVAVQQRTGKWPTKMLLGIETFKALALNPEIKTRFQYTSAASLTTDMLARYFEVDEIVVSKAVYQGAKEGSTGTPSFIGGKHALLAYVDPAPSLNSITAGVTFAWSGFKGANGGIRIKRWREEGTESDYIESQMSQDMKAFVPDCGYFFASVVA